MRNIKQVQIEGLSKINGLYSSKVLNQNRHIKADDELLWVKDYTNENKIQPVIGLDGGPEHLFFLLL